jgi:nicotinamide riboside transporter PnuC|tara:strand:- start:150 stop:404 length:255 start_codon:yes stop_codon:yes gene_type:complete
LHISEVFFKIKSSNFLEWGGVITAISYSLLIALNIGAELIGFSLLFISAVLIALWSLKGNHKGILILQLFYATAAILGFFRWLS